MFHVPAFSQYLDITDPEWKIRSCGPVCVAMTLGYYGKSFPSLDELILIGVAMGAHHPSVGWYHKGLAQLGEKFGLHGNTFDWNTDTPEAAWKKLLPLIQEGPLIASVHKYFNPSLDGHLILITGIQEDKVYYNEPASETREQTQRSISKDEFLQGWKRRIIVLKEK